MIPHTARARWRRRRATAHLALLVLAFAAGFAALGVSTQVLVVLAVVVPPVAVVFLLNFTTDPIPPREDPNP